LEFLVFGFWFFSRRHKQSLYPAKNSKRKTQNWLCARRDAEDLAAFVESAGRAHAVRDVRSIALGAFAQLRELEHAVVSAAHALPAC
jgi:hypothetical protein